MMKRIIAAMMVATLVGCAGMEPGVNRLGSDYKNFDLPSADPALCQKACYSEQQCMAWTYVNPGIQGPNARCWLKNPIPAPSINSCCVSGVK